jgi:cell division protease FtsH
MLTPGTDPIHKVTIIPRGRSLGLTQQLPEDDRYNYSRDYLIKKVSILLGGRVAEELVLDLQSTGAKQDIEESTDLARRMVCEWGMSEKMGPLTFGQKEEQIFLGREIAQHRDYSEKTAQEIDEEVKTIISECFETAKRILKENVNLLHKLAETLLEKEVLDSHQIQLLIKENSAQA